MVMTGGLLSTVEYVASGIGTATPTQGQAGHTVKIAAALCTSIYNNAK